MVTIRYERLSGKRIDTVVVQQLYTVPFEGDLVMLDDERYVVSHRVWDHDDECITVVVDPKV